MRQAPDRKFVKQLTEAMRIEDMRRQTKKEDQWRSSQSESSEWEFTPGQVEEAQERRFRYSWPGSTKKPVTRSGKSGNARPGLKPSKPFASLADSADTRTAVRGSWLQSRVASIRDALTAFTKKLRSASPRADSEPVDVEVKTEAQKASDMGVQADDAA